MYGVIKDNKLLGLYHEYLCPNIYREERTTGGTIQELHSKVKKAHPYYCRWCIYLEAEERGVNCYTICPQLTCLEKEDLPEEMKEEMKKAVGR